MTDEQLIRQLEQALTALKAGDESAIDRIVALLGGDRISVGNISDATGVAIGRNIHMVINQVDLPEALAAEILRAVKQTRLERVQTYSGGLRPIRVFISSPGDVAEERGIAMQVIERLNCNALLRDKVVIQPVAWDRPGARMPLSAHLTPQENIDRHTRPSECDVVVVMFWSRMGLPLGEDRVKPEPFRFLRGTEWEARYLSGTEYEFVEGMQAALEHDQPVVLVYWRTEKPTLTVADPDDPELLTQLEQMRRVRAFFDNFNNPDGSARWSYYSYESPAGFEDLFEEHLLDVINHLLFAPHEQPARPALAAPPAPAWDPARSPFPGLRPFEPEDQRVFFGRERETDALARRLAAGRFVAVVAASGSGKSSLVRAGLIPRLGSGAVPGVAGWHIVTIKPGGAGGDPFKALAAGLLRGLPSLTLSPGADFERHRDELTGRLHASPGPALVAACVDALRPEDSADEVLLFVDQFEELFTVVDEPHREPFARALNALCGCDRARVILTLRADFFDRCLALQPLKPLLEKGTYPLYPPGRSQLYDMIAKPADQAGLTFENSLAEQIWRDTGSEPGMLALLAYALERLWQAQRDAGDGLLRREVYQSFGDPQAGLSGVEGAIGAQARAVHEWLDEEVRAALPGVFARLVVVDRREDGGYVATRRRAPLAEVYGQAGSPEARLVDALTGPDARLLVVDRDEDTGAVTLEVAHEALFRSWARLRDWINDAGEALRLVEATQQARRAWEANDRHHDFLWQHGQMRQVQDALAGHPEVARRLTPADREFLRPEQERLVEELHTGIVHARRSEIGLRLHTIGDTRPGVGLVRGALPLRVWGGDEPMLSGMAARAPEAAAPHELRLWGDKPEHEGLPDMVWLPVAGGQIEIENQTFTVYPFHMARYPITYAQYRAFVKAEDGFSDPRWWKGLSAGDDDKRSPGEQRSKYDNHPAENVSWYAAIAFCRWLNTRVGLPDIPPDLTPQTLGHYSGIRLPAEWEWQFAATGGDPSLEYPWGPEWDGAKANTSESGLSRTTAVGMYPAGAAPCGALDMSGNVYEWCLNEHGKPENAGLAGSGVRVVRGGSWAYNLVCARCSYRDGDDPDFRLDDYGFRVCLRSSPTNPGLKPPG